MVWSIDTKESMLLYYIEKDQLYKETEVPTALPFLFGCLLLFFRVYNKKSVPMNRHTFVKIFVVSELSLSEIPL